MATAGNIIVTFSPVSGIASYQVKYRQTGTSTWIILPSEPTVSPFTIPVSDNSVGYDISMASNCGNGTYSTPYTFNATATSTFTFTVNAMSPSPITGIQLYYQINNSGTWVPFTPINLDSTYSIVGTIPGLHLGDAVNIAVGGVHPSGLVFGTNTSSSGTTVIGYCGQTGFPAFLIGSGTTQTWIGVNGGTTC